MRTTSKITLVLAPSACALAFFWQGSRNAELREEAMSLRTAMASARAKAAPSGASMAAQGAGRRLAIDVAPSSSRGAVTLEDVRALLPGRDEGLDGGAIYRVIPQLVEAVADCTSSELLEIAEGLGGDADSASAFEGFFKILLVSIVSEAEPARALDFFDSHLEDFRGSEDVRSSILSELAKRDPEAALARLEFEGATEADLERARNAVGVQLLRSDVEAGIALLSYTEEAVPMGRGGLIAAAREPAIRENLWREANAMEPGEIRSQIFEALLSAAALGGVENVGAEFARIDGGTPEELSELAGKVGRDLMEIDPEWAIGFVLEHTGEAGRTEALRQAASSWAHQDYNAAGEWLGQQPASADRDAMISGFVLAVDQIDHEAAAAWVAEISDPEIKEAARRPLFTAPRARVEEVLAE